MAILYNSQTLRKWYPKVENHSPHDQMYQALQIFSHQFPQFSHFWQLEMDLRFTGHVYTTLSSAAVFARKQKRKNLWERNGRFYIPGAHNDSFESFASTVSQKQSSF